MKEAKINQAYLAKSNGWWNITVRDCSTNELICSEKMFLGKPEETTNPMRLDKILSKIGSRIQKFGYIA